MFHLLNWAAPMRWSFLLNPQHCMNGVPVVTTVGLPHSFFLWQLSAAILPWYEVIILFWWYLSFHLFPHLSSREMLCCCCHCCLFACCSLFLLPKPLHSRLYYALRVSVFPTIIAFMHVSISCVKRWTYHSFQFLLGSVFDVLSSNNSQIIEVHFSYKIHSN